jgi:uncharacterized protein YjbI with pentapeptide repeats
MNHDQQPQRWWRLWWKDNWLIPVLVALIVVIATITGLGYWQKWAWTGLVVIEGKDPTGAMQVKVLHEPRLFWDWLALLIIPVVLGAGAVWFNQQARKGEQQQRQNELNIAEENRREDILQRYLDTMQGLIFDKRLRKSKKDAEIRNVARARTLTVLRGLDGDRKGQVVRFLHEADLIGKLEAEKRQVIEAIINLGDANLSGANLSHANLSGANLIGADPKRTTLIAAHLWRTDPRDVNLYHDMYHANLSGANLRFANLRFANLLGANLSHANLSGANLIGADLSFTNLSHADLSFADLRSTNPRSGLLGANLSGANLRFTNLSGANLRGVNLSHADLSRADLRGANLYDGSMHPPNLSRADLSGTNLSRADLRDANLSGANLRGTNLSGTNLSGADLFLANGAWWTNKRFGTHLAQAESLVGARMPHGRVMTEEAWEEFKKRYGQSSQAGEAGEDSASSYKQAL